ncbi:hypothetical protein [Nocardioides terrigena]|uniref:hypothetical protein n=1 Tax=Nocardioides terrigena TaxID=424797 RepID=UPI000D316A70|nr:hypothetical protein [Nocardioides terrigena]
MSTEDVLEVHLEELGQHSWWKALANTLSGSCGSAQFRFVARPPGPDDTTDDHVLGATFPVMRLQDLDDLREPNAWVDTAQDRLRELDARLVGEGWERRDTPHAHWWSLTYARP